MGRVGIVPARRGRTPKPECPRTTRINDSSLMRAAWTRPLPGADARSLRLGMTVAARVLGQHRYGFRGIVTPKIPRIRCRRLARNSANDLRMPAAI